MLSLLRSSLKGNLSNLSVRYFRLHAPLTINYRFNGMSPGIVINYDKKRKEDEERKRKEDEERKRKEDETDDDLLIYIPHSHEYRPINGHASSNSSSSHIDNFSSHIGNSSLSHSDDSSSHSNDSSSHSDGSSSHSDDSSSHNDD